NEGDSATFRVIAEADPSDAISFQWRRDGASITNNPTATTAQLTLPAVLPTDAGSYDVVVTSSGCTVASTTVTLSIGEADVPTTADCASDQCSAVVPSVPTACGTGLCGVGPGGLFPMMLAGLAWRSRRRRNVCRRLQPHAAFALDGKR